MTDKKSQTISWIALSHREYHRSAGWYMGFGLVSVGLIFFALFVDHNIITLVTFALLILVVFIFSFQKPVKVSYKLTKLGVHADQEFYPFSIIKNFWIIYEPPHTKTLNFKTTAYINNNLSWDLGTQDPVAVKMFLAEHIDEDLDRKQDLSETLAKTLKI